MENDAGQLSKKIKEEFSRLSEKEKKKKSVKKLMNLVLHYLKFAKRLRVRQQLRYTWSFTQIDIMPVIIYKKNVAGTTNFTTSTNPYPCK